MPQIVDKEINETEINEREKNKNKIFLNKILKLIIESSFTLLFTGFMYIFILGPSNQEIVTHINTPSFPLHNLTIILPNNAEEGDIDCEIILYNKNFSIRGSATCPKNGDKKINITKLINKNIIIENNGYLKIYFYVKDKYYDKAKNEILKISSDYYTLNKDNKVVTYTNTRNYHLDNMIQSSNERKETKMFYYGIKSIRIDNEGDIYDFGFLNGDETIRYFYWNNPLFTKDKSNFAIYLTKENYYQIIERKRIPFMTLFILFFTFGQILYKIGAIVFLNKNITPSSKNTDRLTNNENQPNNADNIGIDI